MYTLNLEKLGNTYFFYLPSTTYLIIPRARVARTNVPFISYLNYVIYVNWAIGTNVGAITRDLVDCICFHPNAIPAIIHR